MASYLGELGYYTHYQEPEFDLLQLGVRFYDPEVGRFEQRDPLALDYVVDSLYGGAMPTMLVDPDGHKCRPAQYGRCSNGFDPGYCLYKLRRCLKGDPKYGEIFRAGQNVHVFVCNNEGDFGGEPGDLGETRWRVLWWSIYLLEDITETWDMCEVFLHELIHVTAGPYGFWRNEDEADRYGSPDSQDSIYKRRDCKCPNRRRCKGA